MKEKICEINKKAKLTKIDSEIKNESWSVFHIDYSNK